MSINGPNTDNPNNFIVQEESQLLTWLEKNLTGYSKTKIKNILKGKGIMVNGKTTTKFDTPLKVGMTISISRTKKKDNPYNKYFEVIYEDKDIIVIDKQRGVLSMGVGKSSVNLKSLLDHYLAENGQKCNAHVVHRLDRETSGLMIYAKNKKTVLIFEQHWREIVYDRRYVALLHGVVCPPHGTIQSWLKDNHLFYTYSSQTDNGGKIAITHYQVLKSGKNHSLVEFKLETGRKNQIRVHAADIGHPVCGDFKYGIHDDPITLLCLKAYRLYFYHPITGKRLEFETPIPQTFKNLLKTDGNNT